MPTDRRIVMPDGFDIVPISPPIDHGYAAWCASMMDLIADRLRIPRSLLAAEKEVSNAD